MAELPIIYKAYLTFTKTMKPNLNAISIRGIHLLMLSFCYFCALSLSAQIPSGYYDPANGLSGAALKSALHDIIKGHTTYPYTSSGTDVWDILKDTDRDPNNSSNVIGLYSAFSMDAAAEYAGGAGWNREHVWAKSRGDFGTTQGAGTDVHHIRAADVSTNSARNNRNFDYAPDQYIDGSGNYSGPTDSRTSSTDWTWEPRDAVKGDVARMIFYMATRYEGDAGEPDLELTETYLTNTDKSPLHARLSTLLAWHEADPVDAAEQQRNDIIYSYQNNRNPFIDHPEYVCMIYSCSGGGNAIPQFTSTAVTSATENQAYAYNITTSDGDAGDVLSITAPTIPSWLTLTDNGDRTALLSGTPGAIDVGSNAVVLNVSDGTDNTNQSFTINVAPVGGGSGNATDLIISEYIERSSYNKGLEIANFTGSSVDLSAYSLQKATNGGGSWGSTQNLSGTLADGDVYVIVHTSADAAMQSVADLITGSGIMTFNGNDAIGLFKNSSLLDLLGDPNSSSNFAKDVTLVRKSTVNTPNTSYTSGEWDTHSNNTFTFLGSHTMDVGTPDPCDVAAGLNSTSVTHNSATLNWGSASGAVSYNLRYRPTGTSTWTETTATASPYGATGLQASSEYEFQVQTVCSASTAAYSVSSIFTTLAEPCNDASGLSSSNITETSADLSWNAVSGAVSYNIRSRATGSSTWTNNSSGINSYNLSGLSGSTEYEFQVQTVCASNSASFTTSSVFTTAVAPQNLLYFSEYIEGSSFNKALEVANTSGGSVNMSGYSVRKQTNGAGSWSSGINLSGNLNNGEVYVLANSSANADIISKADFTGGNSELTFNGNDAIGLFKDGVLIDIIGTYNSSATFGQDVTLRRNDNIDLPNDTYTLGEWTSFGTDNSFGLGQRYGETLPNNPPSVSITAPANGSSFTEGNIISLSANASDTDGSVTAVEFFVDGVSAGTDSASPYSINWTIGVGNYSITAVATDNASASTTSGAVSITGTTASSQVILSSDGFESGWGSFQDGGSDAYRYTKGTYAFSGNAALGIQDNTNSSVITYSNGVDITGYDQLEVEFYFYPRSMDNSNEDFWLQIYDGSNYVTVATWAKDIDFQNNNFYMSTVTLDPTDVNFASNMKVRFRCDASGNADDVYIDEVTVTASSGSGARSSAGVDKQVEFVREGPGEFEISDFELELSIYPNPVNSVANIAVSVPEDQMVSIMLMDINGRVISSERIEMYQGDNLYTLKTRGLQKGIYIVRVQTNDDQVLRKMVKN